MDFLKKVRIRTKIFSGFGVVIALLVLISAIGTWTLVGIGESFSGYRSLARETKSAGQVQANLLGMRVSANEFLIRPNDEAADAVRSSAKDTQALIEGLRQLVNSPEKVEIADRARNEITAYLAAFDEVTKKQAELDELVKGTLEVAGRDMERKLTEIMEAGARDLLSNIALAAGKTLRNLLLERLHVANFLETYDPAAFEAARKEAGEMDKNLVALAETVKNMMYLPIAEEVASLHEKYSKTFVTVHDVVVARNRIITETMNRIGPRVAGMVEELRAAIGKDQDALGASADADMKFAMIFTLSAAALSLLLAALSAWLIGSGISGPIRAITDTMRKLAGGDRSTEIPHTDHTDEIGDMASALQVFKDNLIETERLQAEQREAETRRAEMERRNEEEKRAAEEEKRAAEERAAVERREAMLALADRFEAEVGKVVTDVTGAASQLRSTAESMAGTAEHTTSQSSAVAAASEQASNNVQTVATAAEELASSVQEVGRQVEESARIAGTAASEATATNEKVQGLAEAAQKIGEVVSLINDIASQTNLLALNATIEAARAGDAGKGFAVVASEVKSLANQTAKATEEIAGQIGAIQSATTDAVDAIGSISQTITQVNEIASSIASAVEEQGTATREIAANVQQAARGTQEITSNIGRVSAAAAETGSASTQVLSAAEDLSRQGDALKVQIAGFLDRVRAA